MPADAWAVVGVFIISQLIIWVGLITSLRGDTRAMKSEITDMKAELKKLGDVILQLAKVNGRLDIVDERVLLTGKRLDDLSVRLGKYMNREN